MKRIYIPRDALAAQIRAGRVTAGSSGIGGAFGAAASAVAVGGLKTTEQSGGSVELQFPSACCNCLAEGPTVRPVDSVSIVNRGVPYTFRLAVPHCANCADTAKRKRLGWLGLTAIFLASLVTIAVGVWFVAESQGRTGVGAVAFLVGVVATLRITIAAAKFRRPRPGQASAHQAVYATGVDVEFSGAEGCDSHVRQRHLRRKVHGGEPNPRRGAEITGEQTVALKTRRGKSDAFLLTREFAQRDPTPARLQADSRAKSAGAWAMMSLGIWSFARIVLLRGPLLDAR